MHEHNSTSRVTCVSLYALQHPASKGLCVVAALWTCCLVLYMPLPFISVWFLSCTCLYNSQWLNLCSRLVQVAVNICMCEKTLFVIIIITLMTYDIILMP